MRRPTFSLDNFLGPAGMAAGYLFYRHQIEGQTSAIALGGIL